MLCAQRISAPGSACTLNRTHMAQVMSHRQGSVTVRHLIPFQQVSAAHRRNRLVTTASYSADNYGPMGGDARIKVIGVGGGGGNAVNRMISSGLQVC